MGAGGKHSQLEWTKEMEKAFVAAKAPLTDSTVVCKSAKDVLVKMRQLYFREI